MSTKPLDRFCDCDEPDKRICQLRAPLGMVARGERMPVECRLFHIEGALSLVMGGEQRDARG